jgi:LacI family transcriptional regulator/LacI family xylobiose transport system transcriptional regulator
LSNNRNLPDEEARLLRRVSERELNALSALVVLTARPPETADVETLRQIQPRVPLIQVDRYLHQLDAPYIGVDNRAVGRRAVTHLLDHGLRRVAYISAFMGVSTGRDRYEGYRAALEEAGVGYDPNLVLAEHQAAESISAVASFGGQACMRLLQEGPVDGIVCNSDKTAVGVVQCLRQLGKRVPEDVRVVGCDDDQLIAASSGMRITGFAYPYEEIAEELLLLIRRLVRRPAVSRTRIELEARFVQGETA